MAAGTKYNLTPDFKPEELYRVETGVRKSGPWKLDVTNLPEGAILPVFTPVEADPVTRTISPVRNFKVAETKPILDDEGNPIIDEEGHALILAFIGNNPLAYRGMTLTDGKKVFCSVRDVVKEDDGYWIQIDDSLNIDQILYENDDRVANFVTFDAKKVEHAGPVLCTLLMQAYEVKEAKLTVPIREQDKIGLTSRFQFE